MWILAFTEGFERSELLALARPERNRSLLGRLTVRAASQ
jgi:hypothetical protein